MTFRKALFWLHLVAGLVSGLAIGIMCFTGTMLAFEKELVAWSERDAREITEPPAGAPRLTLDQMRVKLREAQPEARASGIVIQNDPSAAVAFTMGRSGGFYVNPYTGEVREPKSDAMSRVMRTMTEWHRYLGFTGEESRQNGKLVNGVCNIAFCFLAVTGLYLWMPRAWSWRAVQPVIWFRQNSGKARDFNWHNTIGFWSAPVLIVLTLTAIPMSFRKAGDFMYKITGTPMPTEGGGFGGGPAVQVPPPPAGAEPLSQEALFAAVQKEMPQWKTITYRADGGGRGGPGGPGGRGSEGGRGGESRPRSEGREGSRGGGERRPGGSTEGRPSVAGPQAATFTVRESNSWPRTATTTLALNPYTGEVLRRTGYADNNAAVRMRSWTRFLHTGEAVGPLGQIIAGLACFGGVVLVYTGFALSWRRFFGKRTAPSASAGD